MTKDLEFTELAQKISKEMNFCTIDGALYFLEGDGLYRSVNSDRFVNRISSFGEGLTPTTLENLVKAIKYIKAGETTPEKTPKANLCPFNNGVFDFTSKNILPYSSKMAFTSRIDREIVIDAPEVKIVDKFLDDVTGHDAMTKKLLLEVAGMCFYRSNRLRKAVVLVGPARSGKSTFLDLVVASIGQNNIATLDPSDLNATFTTEQLVGKMVNAADDINVGYLKETGALKRVISGGLCLAQKKFKDAFTFRPFAKMIFTSNKMPKMNDPNGGMSDRLIIIPFLQCFKDDNCDYRLIDKLTDTAALAYFSWISINAFCEVLENGGKFTEPETVKKEKESWKLEQDSVLCFASEYISSDKDLADKETSEVYTDYTTWMKDNGLTGIVSKKKMQDSLIDAFGITVKHSRKDKYGKTGFYFAINEKSNRQDDVTNAVNTVAKKVKELTAKGLAVGNIHKIDYNSEKYNDLFKDNDDGYNYEYDDNTPPF